MSGKAYTEDLRRLLDEARVAESKAFLRSFIKRIEIDEGSAKVHYIVPVPPGGGGGEPVGVLPMVNLGGPNKTFAKPIETFFELSIVSAPSTSQEQSDGPT